MTSKQTDNIDSWVVYSEKPQKLANWWNPKTEPGHFVKRGFVPSATLLRITVPVLIILIWFSQPAWIGLCEDVMLHTDVIAGGIIIMSNSRLNKMRVHVDLFVPRFITLLNPDPIDDEWMQLLLLLTTTTTTMMVNFRYNYPGCILSRVYNCPKHTQIQFAKKKFSNSAFRKK